jgi:hypothetical protein
VVARLLRVKPAPPSVPRFPGDTRQSVLRRTVPDGFLPPSVLVGCSGFGLLADLVP